MAEVKRCSWKRKVGNALVLRCRKYAREPDGLCWQHGAKTAYKRAIAAIDREIVEAAIQEVVSDGDQYQHRDLGRLVGQRRELTEQSK